MRRSAIRRSRGDQSDDPAPAATVLTAPVSTRAATIASNDSIVSFVPSGDHDGVWSVGSVVTRRLPEPSTFAIQYSKAGRTKSPRPTTYASRPSRDHAGSACAGRFGL